MGHLDGLRRPQHLTTWHFLPARENGGVSHLHHSEAPVDLQHGHADHDRVLLFRTHDGDQRPLLGDGPSFGQRKAAAQQEPGKQLQQQHSKADQHGERAQEAGHQNAL